MIDRSLISSVQIPLINEHLFYTYFVRQFFGQATKGINYEYKIVHLSAAIQDFVRLSVWVRL